MKKYLVVCVAITSCFGSLFSLEKEPLSIVIIGAGPAGLSAAIEAHATGADVTLVEKRDSYARTNTLFLFSETLEMLKEWQVEIPSMIELDHVTTGKRRGFVFIKDLEEGLAKRVHELGILRIHGKFSRFEEESQGAIIETVQGEISLPYDILVGADGMHSRVLAQLDISSLSLGEAKGVIAMVPALNSEGKIEVETRNNKDVFVRKVRIPEATLIMAQTRPDTLIQDVTQELLSFSAHELGWHEEAEALLGTNLWCLENIHIYLRRSAGFSDPDKSVIILGDAASSASFLPGTGANFSLKTAKLGGEFFQQFGQSGAYDTFNSHMEQLSDELIETSMVLFERDN